MTDEHSYRLDLLILARLATSSRRPPSVAKLTNDLFRFVEARLSSREWSLQCKRGLESLHAEGDIDARRVPTPQGLARLHEALGVKTLPGQWSKIWRALMPALALQLPGARWSAISSAAKLRARLIRQEHELDLPETPTLIQAVDAQAWQALGVQDRGKLTLGKLRRALLERALATPMRAKSLDAAQVGQWLATAAAGTTKRDIEAIQRTLVARWLFDARALPEPSDEQWATRVQAIAESTTSGRYGDQRVFIASVWRATQTDPRAHHGSLAEFKARLVEANRAGLLRLHRADLVGAMDGDLVRDSETIHLNATFHFIEIPSPRTT